MSKWGEDVDFCQWWIPSGLYRMTGGGVDTPLTTPFCALLDLSLNSLKCFITMYLVKNQINKKLNFLDFTIQKNVQYVHVLCVQKVQIS